MSSNIWKLQEQKRIYHSFLLLREQNFIVQLSGLFPYVEILCKVQTQNQNIFLIQQRNSEK
jgi:hypothetical protein